MKFMIAWRIAPAGYKVAVEKFLSTGAPLPEGIESLGRWHMPGSTRGWHIVQGDPVAVAHHVAEWGEHLEADIYPVLDDEAAGKAAAKVYGK